MDNSDFLAHEFFLALAAKEPCEVLDVGCGSGRLLRQCHEAGISAQGIEPDSALVVAMQAEGLTASVARAEALPFADDSFDWVSLRHISHHLADERPAIAEALRVARSGVIVAEPWLDETIASQRVAREFDRWLDVRRERAGLLHRSPVSAGAFLAALPADEDLSFDLRYDLRLTLRSETWIDEEIVPYTEQLEEDAVAREELASIRSAAREQGMSCNGSMILTLAPRRESGEIR